MASFTRVNPTAVSLGTLQSTLQLKPIKGVLSGSNGAVAINAATAAYLTDEIGTTGALLQVKSDGLGFIMIGDGHAIDISSIATRLGRILGAGSITSDGVWTFTAGGTLTVTQPTTLYSL